ncbi:MAG: alanine racemase [Gammaproteobacteria bacterium]|mgnify:CR=1 FL=1|nr:alanine racemase [Gammaproteobacteria bacterium]MBT3724485.1 alanine racemase [Gammaproteobacteria bacterium]MBT4076951.1 alanine racemase [Gammaproteobacteria bacterium]MBT4194159.1 alanine racemase [Gammaproteobacteria bacterium]MBT4448417.1 alanine racemase [Gammaproteobacteria bacterium]
MGRKSNSETLHTRHSRVIIDLEAIRLNYQFLKSTAVDSQVIAVIKADAYGHGALEVAKALPDADAFAVATVLEAIPLREAGIKQKIIILGGVVDEDEMQNCIQFQLDPVIHQFWQIDLLENAEFSSSIDVWLKFNSGMGRLGFTAQDINKALEQVNKLVHIGAIRLMTHLANADDIDDEKSIDQVNESKALDLNDYEWGIANSAGILGWPQSRLNWVRAGIALYGSDPMRDHQSTQSLKPVMQFTSQILAINHLKKGQSIGYSGLYTCPEDQTIAVVAAGYADGYPRHLKNGHVVINAKKVSIVGRVSMDMITVNVTGMNVKAGDEVTLWGANPLANEVADLSETISYELFCHAGCHGKREFINKP